VIKKIDAVDNLAESFDNRSLVFCYDFPRLSKENESWYRNKMRKVMNHDQVNLRDKAKLDKLRYLLAGVVVFALFAMVTLWPVLADATASGGTK
jgi:hypothetical protein